MTSYITISIESNFTEETAFTIFENADRETNECSSRFASIQQKSSDIKFLNQIKINGKASNCPVLYIKILIGKPAKEFFDFLVSIDGYKFLDPDSNSQDFNKPILGPFTKTNESGKITHKVQAEYAQVNMGSCCISNRDFVVMNAWDFTNFTWHCKSVLIPHLINGNTSYSSKNKRATRSSRGNCVRLANNTTYFVESISQTRCCLHVYQWFDLEGWLSSMSKHGTIKYLKSLQKRAGEKFPLQDDNPIKG